MTLFREQTLEPYHISVRALRGCGHKSPFENPQKNDFEAWSQLSSMHAGKGRVFYLGKCLPMLGESCFQNDLIIYNCIEALYWCMSTLVIPISACHYSELYSAINIYGESGILPSRVIYLL